MPQNNEKEKLIQWFGQMKEIEKSAGDTYLKIALDPRVEDKEIEETFRIIALDEERHVEIVKRIINIITNNL